MTQMITFSYNLNHFEIDTWFDARVRRDGGYELIGMSRYTERDRITSALVNEEIAPTGVVVQVPRDCFLRNLTKSVVVRNDQLEWL